MEADIWGYTYSTQHFVATFDSNFRVFNIVFIIKTKSKQIFLCCKETQKVYKHHFDSFECEQILNEYVILNLNDLIGPPVEIFVTFQEKPLIKLKPYYKSRY